VSVPRWPDSEFEAVDPPGPFTEWEAAAIERLLELDHPWNAAAREQLRDARVSARCRHCPSIEIVVPDTAPRLPDTDSYVGAPAMHGTDLDGMAIEITLIPSGDVIQAMDVWRGDGDTFTEPPLETFGQAHYD
jgi:hypothetical protein